MPIDSESSRPGEIVGVGPADGATVPIDTASQPVDQTADRREVPDPAVAEFFAAVVREAAGLEGVGRGIYVKKPGEQGDGNLVGYAFPPGTENLGEGNSDNIAVDLDTGDALTLKPAEDSESSRLFLREFQRGTPWVFETDSDTPRRDVVSALITNSAGLGVRIMDFGHDPQALESINTQIDSALTAFPERIRTAKAADIARETIRNTTKAALQTAMNAINSLVPKDSPTPPVPPIEAR